MGLEIVIIFSFEIVHQVILTWPTYLRPGLSSNLATKETFTAFVQLLHRHQRWKYLFVFCTTPINGFVKTTRIQFNLPLCHEHERADMLNSNLLPLPPSAISIQCHTSGFCFSLLFSLLPDIPTNENVKGTINANETTKLGLTDRHYTPYNANSQASLNWEIKSSREWNHQKGLTISHKSGKHMTLDIN